VRLEYLSRHTFPRIHADHEEGALVLELVEQRYQRLDEHGLDEWVIELIPPFWTLVLDGY